MMRPLFGPRRAAALACWLLFAAGSAQAALFEDDEARKAILDLRARLSAAEQASKSQAESLGAANARLIDEVQQLRRSLVELNQQLEAQRAETARLRGLQEQVQRYVS